MPQIAGEEEKTKHEDFRTLTYIFISLGQFIYGFVGSTLKKYNIKFIHESLVLIALGAIFACVHRLYTNMWVGDDISFSLLLELFLPIIILKEGFTMRKRSFFKNILWVICFGFFGTILFIIVFTIITYYAMNYLNYLMWDFKRISNYDWSLVNVIHVASILASSDMLAPLSMIDSAKYPDLFAIVFGEGVMNDAVSLIGINTVSQIGKNMKEYLASPSVSSILVTFQKCGILSILVGALMASISSQFHKTFRMLHHEPFVETLMIIQLAFVTYFVCELSIFNLSGIVAIFVYGVLQSHYNRYNLSDEAMEKTEAVFDLQAYASEALIFVYLGLSIAQYEITLEVAIYGYSMIIAIIVSRFIVVYFIYFCVKFQCLRNKGTPVTAIDVFLIGISGTIRGAISLALVQKLAYTEGTAALIPITQFVITNVLYIITPLNPILFNYGLKAKAKLKISSEESTKIQTLDNTDNNYTRQMLKIDPLTARLAKKKGFVKSFKYFDEFILKPIMIYDYENRYEEINKEKIPGNKSSLDDETNNFLFSHFFERNFTKIETKFNKKYDENQNEQINLRKKSNKSKKASQFNIVVNKTNSQEQPQRKKSPIQDSNIIIRDSQNSSGQKDNKDIEL